LILWCYCQGRDYCWVMSWFDNGRRLSRHIRKKFNEARFLWQLCNAYLI